jgi:hypothetical protein
MMPKGLKDYLPTYTAWMGRPVVLRVAIRHTHLPMVCRIVGETAADVRISIDPGWEMEIGKNLILGVAEAAAATSKICSN